MEKRKRWHFFLIVATLVLTVYNILPTLFFYSKPLHRPIDAKRAQGIAQSIARRVNGLEGEAKEWLHSYCSLLGLKPQALVFDEKRPQYVFLTFKNSEEAQKFRRHLPRAGALIPFVPAQLTPYDFSSDDEARKTVIVQRKIPVHLQSKELSSYFQFSSKVDKEGKITPLYRALVQDRALELGIALGGISENGESLQGALGPLSDPQVQDLIVMLSQNILAFTRTFGESSPITARYFSSFTQVENEGRAEAVQQFISAMEQLKDRLRVEKIALQAEKEQKKGEGVPFDNVKEQKLQQLFSREKIVSAAEVIVKKHRTAFAAGKAPLSYATFGAEIQKSLAKEQDANQRLQTLSLAGHNPFIEKFEIDWASEKITFHLYADVTQLLGRLEGQLKDRVDQFLYDEIAAVSRQSGEKIVPAQDRFVLSLNQLTNSKGFLAMRLSTLARAEANEIKDALQNRWHPRHPDLKKEVFPISDFDTYVALPREQKSLGLVVYAPSEHPKMPARGFRTNSIYVIAKGVSKILQKAQAAPESEEAKQFLKEFGQLRTLLQNSGYFGYPAAASLLGPEYAGDFIFEKEDYFQSFLKATREDFTVQGTKRFAVLEFTDVEQRILTENKIDTRLHEDLLKWKDDYRAAQLDIKGVSKFDVPRPTKNVFWSNLALSTGKYFRGDDRKILHWGLDLSGGKTVQIELRDNGGQLVTLEADIRQAINELYKRVNRMGVSEVSIRQEGNTITLDFPGSQGLSAQELVKASSMYFHVVNEKFSTSNSALADHVNRFLQEIWNEAVVTNRKDPEHINFIAWKHLHGDSLDPEVVQPRSESAKILYENGLRLANPQNSASSSDFNDIYSKVAIFRGEDFTQWQGQTNPLLLIFRNYALEGSNLENVHASYDPSKGNFLSFGVKGASAVKEGPRFNPRDNFYAWTAQFSKEKVGGTSREVYAHGKGWRMAVILNGSVISAPTLDSALRDSAVITGSFSQREVNQLEADLKAGSLSFTPRILSEKNVSPELGSHERSLGIWATVIALVLVLGVMTAYYRFAGVVASVAVLFNIIIMWATLQNLSATLTLASIAGLILTIAMAVDANVLVFERIREEFAATGRIAHAVQVGYQKAFSAILDSNVTTIIAALILLQFDSGPIKGFAVTLIIGIVSSMLTALFMTRYFFAGWVQKPEHQTLTMANLIKGANFNFLKFTRPTYLLSIFVVVFGCFFMFKQRHALLGMDFTGGYALEMELTPQNNVDYRKQVEKALLQAGAATHDFQIRELASSNNLRIFLSRSIDQSGHPFYGMPPEKENKIAWVVSALNKAHVEIPAPTLQNLHKNWSEISGQLSDTMLFSALVGLGLALLCIFIYIAVRFEFTYAVSATLCLVHDVVFTLAMIALLHALKIPVQIDLNTVAALMTIIGYSLNDTIIIFDRIREDLKAMRKSSFSEIINHALNSTLSRTTMTSGLTLLVLIPLVFLGGSTLFGFALVMSIGVIFGTLSSLFIAAPLLQFLHERSAPKGAQRETT